MGNLRRPRARGPASGRIKEYLLEFIPNGNAVKVCAIDPETGVEVSIVGPVDAGEEILSRNAIRKLKYVIAKRRKAAAAANRRGISI